MNEKTKFQKLSELLEIKIGVCTGNNKKHLNINPIFENSKKVLQGKDINRYFYSWNNIYINYSKKELLRSRDENIFLRDEKLLMRQTSDSLIIAYDNKQYYTIDSLFVIFPKSLDINLKFYLAILNSKLLNRQYQKLNPEAGRVFAQVKIDYVNELPLPVLDSLKRQPIYEASEIQIVNLKNLEELKDRFLMLLQSKFTIEKPSTKLQNWPSLDFKGFLGELKKGKVQLSLSEEADWMTYFTEQKQKALALQTEINRIDAEIDRLVYELYGLTEEEIRIVEGGEG
jgi:hypothetical protein